MDIEKLIEAAKLYGIDAADAITALLAENEKLLKMYQEEKAVCHATQAELEKVRESLDFARTKDAELIRLGMELDHLKKHVKRLTHKLGNGEIVCNMARDDCRKMGGDCQIDSKILDRLAAYEDTGLEPEEIDRILDAYGRGMSLRTENGQRLEIVRGIQTDRLRELAQANREGRVKIEPKARKCPKCGKMRLFQRIDWEYYYCYSCKTQFTSKEVEAALRRKQNG